MALTPSDKIIEFLKQQLGLDEKTYAVMQIWEREVGALAKHATLAGIKKGQLYVDIGSSVHFQELTLRKREIINKINQHFGREKVVKGIKLQLKK